MEGKLQLIATSMELHVKMSQGKLVIKKVEPVS